MIDKKIEEIQLVTKGMLITELLVKELINHQLTFQESIELLSGHVSALEDFIEKNPEKKKELFKIQ